MIGDKNCNKCGVCEKYKGKGVCYLCYYTGQQARRKSRQKPHKPIKSLKGELWVPIIGFEDYYHVSNLGRVKSLYRFFIAAHGEGYPVREKIIKKEKTINGYFRVTLSVSSVGIKKRFSVHRLVVIAFIPNPENKPCVNHINSKRTDNRIENLEWCTYRENIRHGIKMKIIRNDRNNHSQQQQVS